MNSVVQNPAYQTGLEARFAIAARHSRMVRILRVAVPAAVALSMAAIADWPAQPARPTSRSAMIDARQPAVGAARTRKVNMPSP